MKKDRHRIKTGLGNLLLQLAGCCFFSLGENATKCNEIKTTKKDEKRKMEKNENWCY